MPDYPPYMMSYTRLPKILAKVKEASRPDRFTQDFLATRDRVRASRQERARHLGPRQGATHERLTAGQAVRVINPRQRAVQLHPG